MDYVESFLDIVGGAIRQMKRGDKLYNLIREELSIQGHWKNKPRGNPSKGYEKSKFGRE